MSRNYIFIVVIVFILGGVGMFWFSRGGEESGGAQLLGNRLAALFQGNTDDGSSPSEEDATEAPADSYRDESRGFSFRAPGFFMQRIGEEAGEVLLVRKNEGSFSFQIFMTEFNEDEPLTATRIKQDLPDMVIDDALSVLIGEKQDIRALRFTSREPAAGETLEVWFTYGANLYAVTAPAGSDATIGPILETISFE